MTARPVNPAKPDLSSEARSAKEEGRSGAPPSAMVEHNPTAAVIAMLLRAGEDDPRAYIAAVLDNLPREAMAAQIDPGAFKYRGPEFEERRKRTLIIVDAAISAARDQVLGSASVARPLRER